MELNKYQERIFEIGRVENTKLVLPEKEDPRVSLAKRNLSDLYFIIFMMASIFRDHPVTYIFFDTMQHSVFPGIIFFYEKR